MTSGNNMDSALADRLAVGLFVMRIVLGLFMLQWTIEKFVLPKATTMIFGKYLGIDLSANMPMMLGCIEVVIVIAFLLGAYRRLSYGLILLFNIISIGSTWQNLIDPYGLLSGGKPNHLFTAGVVVLATSWLLYWLRDADTKWSFDTKRSDA